MINQTKTKRLAKRATAEILDLGLADSTWRENNPGAYNELLNYRADIEGNIEKIIGGSIL